MSLVHAPYGFVPLSKHVFLPPWQGAVSQDHPFRDSVSGTIDLKITAETAVFVRGGERDEFFRTPDGKYAIPGSSIRGALRNVIEIATFGWMSRFNDHRYGVRDLHNQELYVQHMAAIMPAPDGQRLPMPKVIAGWLRKRPDTKKGSQRAETDIVATITPCHFAKIEYRLLASLANDAGVGGFTPGNRQSAVNKYKTWGKARRAVNVAVEVLRPRGAVGLPYDFGRVTGRGPTKAELVFTGQPSPWRPDQPPRRGGGQAKHHDFVFYGEGTPVEVSRKIFDGFDFVHSDRGQQNARNRGSLRNEEWEYWGEEYDKGNQVPVFFLLNEKGGLRAFGLAMMFRLAYDFSVKDGVYNSQPAAKVRRRLLDFAQTLFGTVDEDESSGEAKSEKISHSLKGRVSFGLARAEAEPKPVALTEVVLGSPKASYYPSYVEQNPSVPGTNAAIVNGKPRWVTWMDRSVQIRGWKRYRPQPAPVQPPLPSRGDGRPMDLSRVASRLNPLPQGTVFTLKVRLHNVRIVELGALLWALDFGGDSKASHTLGMARSLGYGRCRIEVGQLNLEDVEGRPFDDREKELRQFQDEMETFAKANSIPGGWAHSRQIFELRELAHTLDASSPHRMHMRIDDPVKRNEFQKAKLLGHALPSAGQADHWRAIAGVAAPVASQATMLPSDIGGKADSQQANLRSKQAWQRATPAPISAGIKGGTRVEVELTGLTKRDKWRAKILSPAAVGVIAFGQPPTDAAVGKKYTVTVTAGGNLKDVQMKWD